MSTTEPAGQAHYAHKECGGITVWDLSGGFCVKCHAEGLDMEDVERREAAPSATKPCGCGPDEPRGTHMDTSPPVAAALSDHLPAILDALRLAAADAEYGARAKRFMAALTALGGDEEETSRG